MLKLTLKNNILTALRFLQHPGLTENIMIKEQNKLTSPRPAIEHSSVVNTK